MNWNIIRASYFFADYMVDYELCKLVHTNHFKDLWALLGRSMLHFRCTEIVETNGKVLALIFLLKKPSWGASAED